MRSGPIGKVFLVGAGPGDPKLITVKGLEAIRSSDVIVYDRLADPRLLKEAPNHVEKIYVGKLPDRHTMKQEEINQLLVDLALQGKTVTRLKGGDPSVFGRVGEEAQLLAENGIQFEIIPGVSSATAVPAYAGIPVTHREYSSSFAVVTGHESPDKLDERINWGHLANSTDTIVFLMGVAKIEHISNQLMNHGMNSDTPVALIRWGTRPEQETLVGTLKDIALKVKELNFQPPAVIVVGQVVKMRDKIAWFENKPLFGKRILITRARSQASELVKLIEEYGGAAIEFPTITVRKPSNPEAVVKFDQALAHIEQFDWLIFTSVNGVEFFFERCFETKTDVRRMHRAQVAAVGPGTALALRKYGFIVNELPEEFVGEGLFQLIKEQLLPGQKALLPRSAIARAYLREQLEANGIDVTEVEAYENVIAEQDASEVTRLLRNKEIHTVTFTSSSTVRNLMQILRQNEIARPNELFEGIEVACIGSKTAETAREFGLQVTHMPVEATIPALVQCLFEERKE